MPARLRRKMALQYGQVLSLLNTPKMRRIRAGVILVDGLPGGFDLDQTAAAVHLGAI